MKTQEQILAIISELQEQREEALNEVANINEVITLWEQQLDELKSEDSPLDGIMGGNPVNNIPSVSYTYTDTPMAEEYYGG